MQRAAPLIAIRVDGESVKVAPGTTGAAAILIAGQRMFRRSVTGQPRGPLCGIGICFECRAQVDRVAQQRTCQILCRDGMEIRTA